MSAISPVNWTKDGFRKPLRSNDGPSCFEWRFEGERVLIQDSKYAGDADKQPIIVCPRGEWRHLLELTLSARSGTTGSIEVVLHTNGASTLNGIGPKGEAVRLDYTPKEWDAWAKGVADGEADAA